MTLFAGVDPGKTGAIALLEADGRARDVIMMPLVESAKGRDEYDLAVIRDVLLVWRAEGVFVTVEKLHPMPMKHGGVIANFNRGMSLGWDWMLTALKVPHHMVPPRTWQSKMHEGTPGSDTKQRSILAAQRLFPGVSLAKSARARKEQDGKAEALLLAEYGRRMMGGVPDALLGRSASAFVSAFNGARR